MKRLVGILLSVGLVLMLVGCGCSSGNELVGKWKNKDDKSNPEYIEFRDDGTCIEYDHKEDFMEDGEDKQEMKYEVSDNKISFTGGDSLSYKIVDDELQLTEEDKTLLFERAE